jgi:hypothetical protein
MCYVADRSVCQVWSWMGVRRKTLEQRSLLFSPLSCLQLTLKSHQGPLTLDGIVCKARIRRRKWTTRAREGGGRGESLRRRPRRHAHKRRGLLAVEQAEESAEPSSEGS